ncbi:MAG: SurA N-terminal domain-containing protein [Candidatus Woesebacteria bacterium]
MKKTSNSKPRSRTKVMSVEETPIDTLDGVEEMETSLDAGQMSNSPRRGRFLIVGLVIVALLGFAVYKYNYLLTPAVVNGKPIYIWDYVGKLHAQFGRDQLNSMVTEEVINQAVADSKVTVPQSDVDSEVANIEKEASSSGGIAAVLEAQHLSRPEFEQRIRLQLAVKKILADKIKVSDQEVDDAYKKNKDFYKGLSEAQAKDQIVKQLEDQKFQTEASTWLADVRAKAKVDIKFPGLK